MINIAVIGALLGRSGNRRNRTSHSLYLALLALLWASVCFGADVVSTWGGGSGSWTDPQRWINSPPVSQFPNNGNGGVSYDVVVDASGPAYTVELGSQTGAVDVNVEHFAIGSPQGTFVQGLGTLTAAQGLHLGAGTYRQLAGAVIRGTALTRDSGSIELGGTLRDSRMAGNWDLVEYRGALVDVTLDDARIRLNGRGILHFGGALRGTGDIIFNATDSGLFAFGEGTPTIEAGVTISTGLPDGTGSLGEPSAGFVNQGTVSAVAAGSVLAIAGNHWVNQGRLEARTGAFLSLYGSWSNLGVIDVNGGMTVWRTSPNAPTVASVVAQIKAAHDAGWVQQDITSSAAHDDPNHLTGLGYRVYADQISILRTWNGDANLDSVVDAVDYFMIDSGFLSQGSGYDRGDFNYDGKVDAEDYFLIDSAFIIQTVSVQDEAAKTAAVPEPGTTALAWAIAAAAGWRSRRRGR